MAKLAFVVHVVLESGFRDDALSQYGSFVPLNTERLRSFIGPRYTAAALEDLVTAGVLERNPSYSAGRFSRSFRLSPCYRCSALKRVPLSGAALVRKVCTTDNRRSLEAVGRHGGRRIVWDSLACVTLGEEVPLPDTTTPHPNALSRLFTVRDFSERRFWLRDDPNTGRVFHNVSQCPRELRPYLLVDAEPTAEVDIANAQPFFLLGLYPAGNPERKTFEAVVSSGRFYETLFEAMDRRARKPWGTDLSEWDKPGSTHRDRFKRHALAHVLYSEYVHEKPVRSVMAAFARLFPWLAAHIQGLRALPGGNSQLAQQMQRLESALILDRVIPRIARELSGCKPVSIHDGILCQQRFAAPVATILREEAEKIFVTAPKVKIKK